MTFPTMAGYLTPNARPIYSLDHVQGDEIHISASKDHRGRQNTLGLGTRDVTCKRFSTDCPDASANTNVWRQNIPALYSGTPIQIRRACLGLECKLASNGCSHAG